MENSPMVIMPKFNTEEIKDQIESFNNIIINFNTAINIDNVKKEIQEVKSSTEDSFKKMKESLYSFGNSIKGIGTEIAGIGSKAVEMMKKYSDKDVVDNFDKSISSLKQVIFNKFEEPMKKAFETATTVINTLAESIGNGDISAGIDKIAECFGNIINKVCDLVIQWLPNIIEGLGWISSHADSLIPIIVAIGGAIAGLKVANIFVDIFNKVKAMILVFNEFKKLVSGLGDVSKIISVLTGPVGLIAAAIGAVAAAVIYLWNTNEGFRDFIIGAWENIKEITLSVWEGIISFFTETIPEVFQNVLNFFVGIPEWFLSLWENIKEAFFNGWQTIVNFFSETIPAWIQSIINWFGELPGKIGYVLGAVLGSVLELGFNIWNWIIDELPQIIQGIVNCFMNLPGRIWEWLVGAYNNIVQWGINCYNSAICWIGNTINSIINYFSQLPGQIWAWLCNVVNNISQWGSTMLSKGREVSINLVNTIVDIVSSIPGKMIDIGKDIVQGIWDGISNMGSWIKDKIKEFCSGFLDGFLDFFDIHSPSRLFRDVIGINIVKGIGVGIDEELPDLEKDVDNRLEFLTKKMITAVSYEVSGAGENIMTKGMYELISSNNGAVVNNDNGVVQNISFYRSIETPSETARAIKRVGRDLIFG
ncbi:MAG: hypothetical protein E6712_11925 [Clostridium sp.]|uniref:hypothetical protein n=1 Tax=Clostridium sp. TaxID=1506 RepID=UPI0029019FDA|nr:hypothetical protein [Clostridium sp.]MDU1936787.1 hypothetical protein [Clostridium sp.]MDU2045497.1 hypothetical protein [Clostridium sp.]